VVIEWDLRLASPPLRAAIGLHRRLLPAHAPAAYIGARVAAIKVKATHPNDVSKWLREAGTNFATERRSQRW